jgi:hypothetical protein
VDVDGFVKDDDYPTGTLGVHVHIPWTWHRQDDVFWLVCSTNVGVISWQTTIRTQLEVWDSTCIHLSHGVPKHVCFSHPCPFGRICWKIKNN